MQNRRSFIRGSGLVLSAAALGGLAACSRTSSGGDDEGDLLSRLQDAGKITVGFAGEAPYSFDEGGEVTGATVALHREIFGELGIDTVEGKLTDWGSLILGVVGIVALLLGHLLLKNPALTGESIGGHRVFNTLILAYLLPALLCGVLYFMARDRRPELFVAASGAAASDRAVAIPPSMPPLWPQDLRRAETVQGPNIQRNQFVDQHPSPAPAANAVDSQIEWAAPFAPGRPTVDNVRTSDRRSEPAGRSSVCPICENLRCSSVTASPTPSCRSRWPAATTSCFTLPE